MTRAILLPFQILSVLFLQAIIPNNKLTYPNDSNSSDIYPQLNETNVSPIIACRSQSQYTPSLSPSHPAHFSPATPVVPTPYVRLRSFAISPSYYPVSLRAPSVVCAGKSRGAIDAGGLVFVMCRTRSHNFVEKRESAHELGSTALQLRPGA